MSASNSRMSVVRLEPDMNFSFRVEKVQIVLQDDLMACDATIGFFEAAAQHRHWKLLVRPFPPDYISPHNGNRMIDELRVMLDKIPKLSGMLLKINNGDLTELQKDVIDFLYWLFYKGIRHRLRTISEQEYRMLGPYFRNDPRGAQPTAIYELRRGRNVFQTYNNLFNHAAFYPGRVEYYYLMLSTSFDLYHMFSLVNEEDKDPFNPDLKSQEPIRLLSLLSDAVSKTDEQPFWHRSEVASMCKSVGMAYVKHEEDVIKISNFQSDLRMKTLQVGDASIAKLQLIVFYGSIEEGRELPTGVVVPPNHSYVFNATNSWGVPLLFVCAFFSCVFTCFLY